MGMVGFIFGTVVGQFSGAWVYWRVRDNNHRPAMREALAGAAAGLVTAVIATAMYVPLGVHTWAGGISAPWGMSAFIGLAMGLCQAVLFRGRPLRPSASAMTYTKIIATVALIAALAVLAAVIPGIRALVFGPDTKETLLRDEVRTTGFGFALSLPVFNEKVQPTAD